MSTGGDSPTVRLRGDRRWARVFEVTRAEPGQIVFEVSVASDDANWTIYRAEHLADVPLHSDD